MNIKKLHLDASVSGASLYSGEIVFRPDHDATSRPVTVYQLYFPHIERDGAENMGCGFGFACDSSGYVFPNLCAAALDNLKMLLTTGGVTRKRLDGAADQFEKYGPGRVQSWEAQPTRERAWLVCGTCGRQVLLCGFTNTCECGADYNMSGDLLAPRSQWGEETGETLSDILGADRE